MPWRHTSVLQLYLYSFFNLNARSGWVISATPQPLYPSETPCSLPTVQEAGWASEPIGMDTENLTSLVFKPRTVQPAASCYNDYAIPAHSNECLIKYYTIKSMCQRSTTHPRLLYLLGKKFPCHWMGCWVGPTVSLDSMAYRNTSAHDRKWTALHTLVPISRCRICDSLPPYALMMAYKNMLNRKVPFQSWSTRSMTFVIVHTQVLGRQLCLIQHCKSQVRCITTNQCLIQWLLFLECNAM